MHLGVGKIISRVSCRKNHCLLRHLTIDVALSDDGEERRTCRRFQITNESNTYIFIPMGHRLMDRFPKADLSRQCEPGATGRHLCEDDW